MNDEKCFFLDWEKIKSQLSETPDNEPVIKEKMQVNDGITKTFVLYLAAMW